MEMELAETRVVVVVVNAMDSSRRFIGVSFSQPIQLYGTDNQKRTASTIPEFPTFMNINLE